MDSQPPDERPAPTSVKRHKSAADAVKVFDWWAPLPQLTAEYDASTSGGADMLNDLAGERPASPHMPTAELLDALCAVLRDAPRGTLLLAKHYRPVLLPLASHAVRSAGPPQRAFELAAHEALGEALTLLLTLVPTASELRALIVGYYERAPSPLERLQLGGAAAESEGAVLRVARTAVQLLLGGCRGSVSWAPLFALLRHASADVRWYAAKGVAELLGMSDDGARRLRLAVSASAAEPAADCLEAQELASARVRTVMGWPGHASGVSRAAELGQWMQGLTALDGVLLPRRGAPLALADAAAAAAAAVGGGGGFVRTSSASQNLNAAALALGAAKPILLEGTAGCGKTALIHELARLTGNADTMMRINLDDQLDSKVLLGTYICTDVPGEFRWQPGALTTAVSQGRWIVFEDIHCAPFELLVAIKPLLEERTLFIPGRGETVRAADGFQLFATQTTLRDGVGVGGKNAHGGVLANLFNRVMLQSPTDDDVVSVLRASFPTMRSLLPGMVATMRRLMSMSGNGARGREPSQRHLLQWAQRVQTAWGSREVPNRSFTTVPAPLRETVLLEAMDVFCGAWARSEVQLQAVQAIAEVWLVSDRVDHLVNMRKPEVRKSDADFTVGRSTLRIESASSIAAFQQKSRMRFAYTFHSLQILEKVAVAVRHSEPVLLVGETGTGKTSGVQHLAEVLGQRMVAINLNQQTDTSDLLGGFKPVDMAQLARPVSKEFIHVFGKTFSKSANAEFLREVARAEHATEWEALLRLIQSGISKVDSKLQAEQARQGDGAGASPSAKPMKPELRARWRQLRTEVQKLDRQRRAVSESRFAFSFVEGALVRAIREGCWILLDEINLAPAETLERLSGLLDGRDGSIVLTERGDTEMIPRHPNFQLFACMNPATDAGKKDLPAVLRSRFTEITVREMEREDDIRLVVRGALQEAIGHVPEREIVNFYLAVRKSAASGELVDGTNSKPVYSLRTLTRALDYTAKMVNIYGLDRALYDGIYMSFATQLQRDCAGYFEALITNKKTGLLPKLNAKKLKELVKRQKHVAEEEARTKVQFQGFVIDAGEEELQDPSRFVLTDSVKANLLSLARGIVAAEYPILLQGPTSSGKTSMVEYIAKKTGHRFVRINNHDHTEVSEYIGGYSSMGDGQMKWLDGILTSAVKSGWWLVLDELNLAPSEVLEALNRLLDGNRELFIPETQEVVRPHPHFRLFATQNPPGLYGGRKVLSRAFRNRFLELHIDDMPTAELKIILEKRCQMPTQFSSRLVAVMTDLQQARQSSKMFAGKSGFITPRDLFRWAERKPDDYQTLADHGYMLLAERARKSEERDFVRATLEKHMKVKIDVSVLYAAEQTAEFRTLMGLLNPEASEDGGEEASDMHVVQDEIFSPEDARKVVWTQTAKRVFTLLRECIANKEPVLLVGGTGIGKTTICQLFSCVMQQPLSIVNCHQHTDTADFIGGFRPLRGREQLEVRLKQLYCKFVEAGGSAIAADADLDAMKSAYDRCVAAADFRTAEMEAIEQVQSQLNTLFSWYDGSLVTAMQEGKLFLIDEISLADDAVLERLNSVLEPDRTLVLAEKSSESVEQIVAHEQFRIFATMNPGGDFGKKELSPALRNRFTEIWVPDDLLAADLQLIVDHHFGVSDAMSSVQAFGGAVVDFVTWLDSKRRSVLGGNAVPQMSLRDILTWVEFMRTIDDQNGEMSASETYKHGASIVLLDGLGIGRGALAAEQFRAEAQAFLMQQVQKRDAAAAATWSADGAASELICNEEVFGVSPFFIPKGPATPVPLSQLGYMLERHEGSGSGGPAANCLRVLRAMQLHRPILLEGAPGVGKTSLINAMARAAGYKLVRINLSEQTELADLFGCDLPVAGGKAGQFEWRDGAFLSALKAGDWVLLDEMNLASQAVLEGLNSCLDHRGTVFIPEIGREFVRPSSFRVFCAQNPIEQGGGRKGLPKSFLNRFTKVHVTVLLKSDLEIITRQMYPAISEQTVAQMVAFNCLMQQRTTVDCSFGRVGGPWDFNLRDILRWCELATKHAGAGGEISAAGVAEWASLIYVQRMRTVADREAVRQLFKSTFGTELREEPVPGYCVSPDTLRVGTSVLPRLPTQGCTANVELLSQQLQSLESLMKAVEMGWLSILVGAVASGKTSVVRLLAKLTGHSLCEYTVSPSADTSEFLGCFEQASLSTRKEELLVAANDLLGVVSREVMRTNPTGDTRIETVRDLFDGYWTTQSQFSRTSSALNLQNTAVNTEQVGAIKAFFGKLSSVAAHFSVDVAIAPWVEKCDALLSADAASLTGVFEWIDGTFLQAVEFGGWVVLDNVNLCEPTVIDRLNSLLESDGSIMVNEQGLVDGEVRCIRPHPGFRLFMVMDPAAGEISRAMRNRGIEIAMMPMRVDTRDTLVLLNGAGIPGITLPTAMAHFHATLVESCSTSNLLNSISIRDVMQWSVLFQLQLRCGVAPLKALQRAALQIYGRVQGSLELDGASFEDLFDEHFQPLLHLLQPQMLDADGVEALANELESHFSAGVWPQHLSSDDFMADSTAAMLQQQTAVLKTIVCQQQHIELRGQIAEELASDTSDVEPMFLSDVLSKLCADSRHREEQPGQAEARSARSEQLKRLTMVACKLLVHSASFSDWQSRLQWLDGALSQAAILQGSELQQALSVARNSFKTVFSEATSELWNRSMDGACEGVRAADLPIDMASFCANASRHETDDDKRQQASGLTGALAFVVWTALPQTLLEEFHIAEAKDLGEQLASPLQLSWVLSESSEPAQCHAVVRHLFALFRSVQCLVFQGDIKFSYLTASALSAVLGVFEQKQNIWRVVSAPGELDLYQLVVAWHPFAKACRRLFVVEELSPVLRELQQCMARVESTWESMTHISGAFWKYGGRPQLPPGVELAQATKRLYDSAIRLSIPLQDLRMLMEQNFTHPAFFVTLDIKRMLVDAIATAQWAADQARLSTREADSQSQDMTDVTSEVAKRMDEQLSVAEAAYSEDSALPMEMVAQLWRLHSHSLAQEEHCILAGILEWAKPVFQKGDGFLLPPDALPSVQQSMRQMAALVQRTLADSHRSCAMLVPHQQLLWASQSETESARLIDSDGLAAVLPHSFHSMLYNWHASLWQFGAVNFDRQKQCVELSLDGPRQVVNSFLPFFVSQVVNGWQKIPMGATNAKLQELAGVTKVLLSQPIASSPDPAISDWLLALDVAAYTMSCFAHKVPAEVMELLGVFFAKVALQVRRSTSMVSSSVHPSLQGLRAAIRGTWLESTIWELVETILVPVSTAGLEVSGSREDVIGRGKLWVALGVLRLTLASPSRLVDPVEKARAKKISMEFQLQDIEDEIAVRVMHQLSCTGSDTNDQIEALKQKSAELTAERDGLLRHLLPRPVPSQFPGICSELWKFRQQFVSTKLPALVELLCSGELPWNAAQQEFTAQETLSGSIHRLESEYPLYQDVTQPCALAIYEIKYGLRMIVDEVIEPETDKSLAQLLNTSKQLLALPSVEVNDALWSPSVNLLQAYHASTTMKLGQTFRVASLAACLASLSSVSTLQTRMDESQIGVLANVFAQFIKAKAASDEEARAAAEEAAKTFKPQAMGEGDAEDNEEEEESLFPNFHEAFDDLTQDAEDDFGDDKKEDPAVVADAASPAPVSMAISPKTMALLARSHRHIFSAGLDAFDYGNYLALVRDSVRHGYETGIELLSTVARRAPAQISNISIADGLMYACGHCTAHLQGLRPNQDATEQSHGDVYTDPIVGEVSLAREPLLKLNRRLVELLAQWEDHPILLTLIGVSKRILSFPVTTPLMKVLTGLEILQKKALTWQATASKQVSIAVELKAVEGLVVRWRKIELQSWDALLDGKFEDVKLKTARLWFRLYELVPLRSASELDGEAPELNEENIFEALAAFMQQSSLGEFTERLDMLHTFHLQLIVNLKTSQENRQLARLANLILAVKQYYEQYVDPVVHRLADLRRPIEKELKGFVKIARWDDSNYYSLKASVDKSHAMLSRFGKKYLETLQSSVGVCLSQVEGTMTMDELTPMRPDEKPMKLNEGQIAEMKTAALRVALKERELDSKGKKQQLKERLSNAMLTWDNEAPLKVDDKPLYLVKVDAQLLQTVAQIFGDLAENDQVSQVCGLQDSARQQHRLPHLQRSVVSNLNKHLFLGGAPDVRQDAVDSVERTAASIIQRSLSLREKAPLKNMKQKALTELLHKLADSGLNYHSNPAIMAMEMSKTPAKFEFLDSHCGELREAVKRSDSYYYRNISRLQRMRGLTNSAHADLTAQETQKLHGFIEHLFLMLAQQRRLVCKQLRQLHELRLIKEMLTKSAMAHDRHASAVQPGADISSGVEVIRAQRQSIEELVGYLAHAQAFCEGFQLVPSPDTDTKEVVALIERCAMDAANCKAEIDRAMQPLDRASRHVRGSLLLLLGPSLAELSARVSEQAAVIAGRFTAFDASRVPRCVDLAEISNSVQAIVGEISAAVADALQDAEGAASKSFAQLYEDVIKQVLLSVQDVCKVSDGWVGSVGEESGEEQTLLKEHELYIQLLRKIDLSGVISSLSKISVAVVTSSEAHEPILVACLAPMFAGIEAAQVQLVTEMATFHSATSKLLFVLLSVGSELIQKGYCKPSDEPEGKEGEMETAAGTGMGEGEGKKDVSDEIEDEEQLLGLQSDEKHEREEEEEEQAEGKEMENDFDGELEERKDDEDQEDDSDVSEEEDEPDREMDDSKGQDQVDEKMWGEGEDDDVPEEEDDVNNPQETGGMDELRAKDEEQQDEEANDKAKDQPPPQETPEDGEPDENEVEEGVEENDEEENDENFVDKIKEKEEEFELPEDMNIDEDGSGGEDEENPAEDEEAKQGEEEQPDGPESKETPEEQELDPDNAEDGGDKEEGEEGDGENEEELPEVEMDNEGGEEQDKQDDGEEPDPEDPSDQIEPDKDNEDNEEEEDEDADAREEQRLGDEAEEPEEKENEDGAEQKPMPPPPGANRQQETENTVMNEANDDQNMDTAMADADDGAEMDDDAADMESAPQSAASTGSSFAQMQSEKKSQQEDANKEQKSAQESNPYRSFADAMRQWKQRLNVVDDSAREQEHEQDDPNQAQSEEGGDADAFEFVHDDEAAADDETLAPTSGDADQENIEELAQEDTVAKDEQEPQPMDAADRHEPEQKETSKQQEISAGTMAPPKVDTPEEEQGKDQGDEEDGVVNAQQEDEEDGEELAMEEERSADELIHVNNQAEAEQALMLQSANEQDHAPISREQLALIRERLERQLTEWRAGEGNRESALEIWRSYDRATEAASHELCEQLRLVLEPTKASKMKGGYNSGKRINMRAVIPYIASGFKKDKIWLRRSMPDKRDYKIMLVIDDTASMSDVSEGGRGDVGQIASEAMIVLCKAMAKLEVGTFAVAKCGEQVDLLLPFDRQYSDEVGAELLSQLTYKQEKTVDVIELINFSTGMFESAGAGGGGSGRGRVEQLMIIITDGGPSVFPKNARREQIQRQVRQAEERGITCALVLVDNPPTPDESIFKVQSVSFENGKVKQSMFLDEFPFPFYAVLSEIGDIPVLLGDALRQWLEASLER